MGYTSLRKQKSFSLIEMLVVVSILGILAGIIFPVLNAARKRSKNPYASQKGMEQLYRADKPIKGKVTENYFLKNPSMQDPVLKLRVEDGRDIGLTVIDGGSVKKGSLAAIAETGKGISFPSINIGYENKRYVLYEEETSFTKDTLAGTKRADRIKIEKLGEYSY